MIAAFLLLGGGRTDASVRYAIEFCLGIGLLALLFWQGKGQTLRRLPAPFAGLIAALLLLPVIQLVPLPPGWTAQTSGPQTAAIRALADHGAAWLPLTLTPQVTAQLLFSLVALLGVFLAVVSANARGVRLIAAVILLVEVLTVVTGVLQLTSGGRLFDFYSSPHRFNLIGFFVNRNHTAVFLGCTIPIAIGFLSTGRVPPRTLFAATSLIAAGVLIAVFGTVSRAGIVLTAVGFLLSLAFMVPVPARARSLTVAALAIGTVAFGFLLFASATVSRVFDRYADVGDDLRWRFYTRTLALVPQYLPWGGGFGSFVPIYTANEPLGDVNPAFVNNAHNDYLEVLLETGWLGGAMVIAMAATIAWAGWNAYRMRSSPERSWGLAGLVVAILFLAHSMVDYPLRRMAGAVVFTVALALLARPLMRRSQPSTEHP